jgi:SAM-dependent methyltransferase
MSYNAKNQWSRHFGNTEMAWPSEYVIRIFKGRYPRLNLKSDTCEGKKICDVGCGDGRNLVLLKKLGFDVHGIEITEEIIERASNNLKNAGIYGFTLKVGVNDKIPYGDDSFDYLLSWNSCYYMGDNTDFNDYVREFARVIKRNGFLILSVPKCSCFIFRDSEQVREGYRIIKNDPFEVRNGEIMRIFKNEDEIKDVFSSHFKDFIFGSIQDDCFGLDYHWHLVVCRKL